MENETSGDQTPNTPVRQNKIDALKNSVIRATEKDIAEYVASGRLVVPQGYSVRNAIHAAWLMILETYDMNKKPALEVCTPQSIQAGLLSMVVQGLDPMRKQVYPIVRGRQLCMDRSYFGDMAMAKRFRPGIDITKGVIYKGDEFDFEIDNGRTRILKHKQTLEGRESGEIRAAYAILINENGEQEDAVVMTKSEIENSWKQSKS
jgi:recombination protein RecT